MRRLGFFLLLLAAPLAAVVDQNNDVQVWVTEALRKELPSCRLTLANEWRIGNNISQLYYFYLQGDVYWKVNDWFELGPGYRQIWQITGTQWFLIYEPLAQMQFRLKKGSFEFEFRHRFSYLIREQGLNSGLYRGRARWLGAWKVKNRVCRPYLSNEIFVDTRSSFYQDRLMAGIMVPLVDHLLGDFYYMIRFQEVNGQWTHQNVFGTWINFNF